MCIIHFRKWEWKMVPKDTNLFLEMKCTLTFINRDHLSVFLSVCECVCVLLIDLIQIYSRRVCMCCRGTSLFKLIFAIGSTKTGKNTMESRKKNPHKYCSISSFIISKYDVVWCCMVWCGVCETNTKPMYKYAL